MIFGREPVVWAALVQAIVVVVTVFGLGLTDVQATAINALVGVVLTVVARSKVTPVADPKLV